MGNWSGFESEGKGFERYACGRPSTYGSGVEVWLNPGHHVQAASVLAPEAELPVTTGTMYRAKPMLTAVLSLTRTARPMRGRKTFFWDFHGWRLLLSVKTQAPSYFGVASASRSAGMAGGFFCMAGLGTERSRYREKISLSSYGADSH